MPAQGLNKLLNIKLNKEFNSQSILRSKNILFLNLSNFSKNIFYFILFLFLFSFSNSIYAATRTWDGGGVDNNWSTAANWSSDTAPIAGDVVVFNSTSTKDSTINAGFGGSISSLDFLHNLLRKSSAALVFATNAHVLLCTLRFVASNPPCSRFAHDGSARSLLSMNSGYTGTITRNS